ncbi:acyl-CoA mutase large subunit family protein [Glycomyces algeriensis]|uniref:Methylmalonyl-CoA mutase n=1 Tax=Glycomyces algeriensis TaxID=256037 RepID=A0A9W6G7A7_9ACTN|nr:methylmalonyl-CoA mutase family protein [Glycomyces algeriensis]MDA1365146.1 methylmalonyl-CoA mutase family protein [Glycomyces algeriensis]MDR7349790.1 methylmalonyl-CoA mutase N-terminal domain/subunit [Glycomyces algeriensis]GLI42499.1 methylmalonyl-CoA mutase [Glycomyces algeriensis]
MDADQIDEGRARWAKRYAAAARREADFTTLSGLETEPVYGPPEGVADPRMERIGWPGEFPFTRGLYPTGYRGRPWTIRQFAGFGNAEQTNARYKMLLKAGGGGLSVAFDMPTLMGRDSDESASLGEVGHCGVAIDSTADMDRLFAGIDLGGVTTSMTISGPAIPIFCMYLAAAERQGVDISTLDGTLQTDIHKEYIAQKEWLFPPEPHLRLIGDLMAYCAENIPRYKPLSVSGYHIREAGSTAAQELAFTLADGFSYVELGLSRGLDVDRFAPGLSFFFDAHIDFFEEIAKFRAARRIWARWLRDVYGAKTDRAQWLRFHTQTAGVSLTAQQPYNNVVRTAVEALAAIMGGTNSLHTNALDETLALPTDQSAEIALRTQSVLRDETGVLNVADPLGGSWYVEALTDKIEAEAEKIFLQILALGGTAPMADSAGRGADPATAALDAMNSDASSEGAPRHEIGPVTSGILQGIEDGWFNAEIAEAAFTYQQQLEDGTKHIVGVTELHDTVTPDLEILRISGDVEREQNAVLARRRAGRDNAAVDRALAEIQAAAKGTANLIEPILAAARAEATLGEICGVLRVEWGEYRETTGL